MNTTSQSKRTFSPLINLWSMGSTYIDHTTASVKSRLKSDTVTLVDGNTCKLIGQFDDVHNCLPAQIASKFKCGMPRLWHKVLDMRIVYADSIEGYEKQQITKCRSQEKM
ncbi:uncharacterized protein LOC126427150 [Schistocerca serialis cubense]|uniref:uncharacterized protein LOC126427150 n=1 Tax=Schistocerca serialis cubense TaxID=2023355 RepID=UPI00214F10DB|nr:uncharacterized protein LOC126427150 [Schistocerca serialis cubense]